MKLTTPYGTLELADYQGTSGSPSEFATWFSTTFGCSFDYTNRDAFLDDFRWGFLEQGRYSGIAHTGALPKFFDDSFYVESLAYLTKEFAERGQPTYFCW